MQFRLRGSPLFTVLMLSMPSIIAGFSFGGATMLARSWSLSIPRSAHVTVRSSKIRQTSKTMLGRTRRPNTCGASAARVALPELHEENIATTDVEKVEVNVEQFESELDMMAVVTGSDSDSESDVEKSPSPARLSLLESNVRILEHDCNLQQLVVGAAKSKTGNLYLGLDISTQSTGYTVLTPAHLGGSTVPDEQGVCRDNEALVGQGLGARLVEWGCIVGSGNGAKNKKDVVDVGIVIAEGLREVAKRCRSGDASVAWEAETGLSAEEEEGEDQTGRRDPTWVVGVEDFMRRFLPGRSNARSIFALAQLNGIVKYACQKHLGAKAEAFHPSKARSFYGLLSNKPEGKDMKEIVHDFALANEPAGLQTRQDWPLLENGSKADEADVDTSGNYDVTDSYLIARYSWHQDVFKEVANDKEAKARFVESFETLHSDKLKAAEERALALFMAGDMPVGKGKRQRKPLTEREARNAHRKLEAVRLTKAYETALLHWFRQRVLASQ